MPIRNATYPRDNGPHVSMSSNVMLHNVRTDNEVTTKEACSRLI